MNSLDNPRAFPRPASRGNNYVTGEEDVVVDPQQGMLLADFFAAYALMGLAANAPADDASVTARRAYALSEAMLMARKEMSSRY